MEDVTNPEVQEIIQNNGALIFAVIGLTQGIKMLGVPSKYLPFASMALGILFGLAQNGFSFVSGLHGLVIGIASTGLVNRADKYLKGSTAIEGGVVEVTPPE